MNHKCCKLCEFYKSGLERCCRNPPVSTGDPDSYDAHWPLVHSDDWCGEWKPKPTAHSQMIKDRLEGD